MVLSIRNPIRVVGGDEGWVGGEGHARYASNLAGRMDPFRLLGLLVLHVGLNMAAHLLEARAEHGLCLMVTPDPERLVDTRVA